MGWGLPGLVSAAALVASCERPPASIPCEVDQDCPNYPYQSCVGPGTTTAPFCYQAPPGVCQVIDLSGLGASCTTDADCKTFASYCSFGSCALNSCLTFDELVVICEAGDCPNVGSDVAVVVCPPGCRAGNRFETCRSCFCPSCPAIPGDVASTDAGLDAIVD
jgi:hypothetical protein